MPHMSDIHDVLNCINDLVEILKKIKIQADINSGVDNPKYWNGIYKWFDMAIENEQEYMRKFVAAMAAKSVPDLVAQIDNVRDSFKYIFADIPIDWSSHVNELEEISKKFRQLAKWRLDIRFSHPEDMIEVARDLGWQ